MTHPILVTGGSGFVGGYIVRRLLDQDRSVVVLDVGSPRAETAHVIGNDRDVVYERASIDDWPSVMEVVARHRPSGIVHAGGIMDTDWLDRHPLAALRTNVGGSLNLLEAARLVGCGRRFVFLSTVAVIGRVLVEPITAEHPAVTGADGPLGAYSAAKAAVEAFLYTYVQKHGFQARIVRPSAVYGFGMSWFAPNYVKNVLEPALEGEEVNLPSGGQVPRDYCNVVDLAELVVRVLDAPDDAPRVYFGGTGGPLQTASDVAHAVRELLPGSAVHVGDEWTDVDREEAAIRGVYDMRDAFAIGYRPRFRDLRDGVADYIERYQDFLAHGGVPTPIPPGLRNAPGMAT